NVVGMGGLMKGQVASYSDADIEAVSEYISKF
ncbi:MAG TPA: cytochrome c, partial [Campylobacterales bacterium]|nr:cytochrome c [Campylobacterales bacterium]